MLYRAEAFEPLTEAPWDEERVREGIREIVAETDAALRGPKLLWRADPWDSWQATSPMKNLYVGAAGVLLALELLRRRGHVESRLDLADLSHRNLERFRARPDLMKIELPQPATASLFDGETGIQVSGKNRVWVPSEDGRKSRELDVLPIQLNISLPAVDGLLPVSAKE